MTDESEAEKLLKEQNEKLRDYYRQGLICGPINFGEWDDDGKFHGSTNYSGEAVRAVLTIRPREAGKE